MKKFKNSLNVGLTIALTLGLAVGVYAIQQQTAGNKASASSVPSTIYFSPEVQSLPNTGPLSLIIDASTNQLAFARASLQFDPKLLLWLKQTVLVK